MADDPRSPFDDLSGMFPGLDAEASARMVAEVQRLGLDTARMVIATRLPAGQDPVQVIFRPQSAVALVANRQSGDVTILEILTNNSYSQGHYGTGFTSDLSAIDLPLTLAPGEEIAFPVHYSAAGQNFPSRLTVRVRSTASEDYQFGFPYRGDIAGCVAPTPTPTPTHACAGDCDGNGVVTIAELVRGVALALLRDVAACANADLDASGAVRVNELVAAVSAATEGCPR